MQATRPTQKVTFGQSFNNLIYPGIQDIRGVGGFFVRLIAVWVIGLELLVNSDGRGARATPLSMILLAVPFHLVMVACAIVFESGYTFWGDIEWGIGEEVFAMMLLMLVSGLFRRFHGWEHLRSGREPRVHTYYLGDSILRHAGSLFPRALGFTRSHWVGHLLINPIFCVILGILVAVSGDSDVVAIYFIVGGFLMMFKNQQLWELVVNMVLNEYDATLSRHKRPQIIASERQHSIRSIPVSSALADIWSQIDTMEVDTDG